MRFVMRVLFVGIVMFSVIGTVGAHFTPQEEQTDPKAQKEEKKSEAEQAERILRLRRAIAQDKEQIEEIRKQLDSDNSPFAKTEAKFNELDLKYQSLLDKEDMLRKSNKTAEADMVRKEREDLKKDWQSVRDQFALLIEERKTMQQQLLSLQNSMLTARATLDRVMGLEPLTNTNPNPEKQETEKPKGNLPNIVNPLAPQQKENGEPPVTEKKPEPSKTDSKEIREAASKAEKAQTDAELAKLKKESITKRLESLENQIDLEQKLYNTAKEQADLAVKDVRTYTAEIREKQSKGAPEQTIQEIWKKLSEAQDRSTETRGKMQEISDRIAKLQNERSTLLGVALRAAEDATEMERKALEAERELAWARNPFSPQNLTRWLTDHGIKIVGIILLAFVFMRLARFICHRTSQIMIARSRKNKSEEREERTRTMFSVVSGTLQLIIIGIAILMVLSEVGVPIAPLLGGAAVFGLGISFASQNLIRDYFTGFSILLEDQYGIGDVVEIGTSTGVVEKMTLRVTMLRDLDGRLHFIPHGTITTVINLTHTWSRMHLDIGVAYKENVDEVIKVLRDLGKEMQNDLEYGFSILEELQILGVDNFADSAVLIKIAMKTKPREQWPIKREFLRRLKNRFDELGIEIPFPHRTVYHRTEGGNLLPEFAIQQEMAETNGEKVKK